MRIVVDKGIGEDLAAALAKLALRGEQTPQRYLVEVDKDENTVLIAKRGEFHDIESIVPLGARYRVLMSDIL